MLYKLTSEQWQQFWKLPVWEKYENHYPRMMQWVSQYRSKYKLHYIEGYCETTHKHIARVSGPEKYIKMFLDEL